MFIRRGTFSHVIVLLLALFSEFSLGNAKKEETHSIDVVPPKIILNGINFELQVNISARANGSAWPNPLCWEVRRASDGGKGYGTAPIGDLVAARRVVSSSRGGHLVQRYGLSDVSVSHGGLFRLQVRAGPCVGNGTALRRALAGASVPAHGMPGWLALTPPVLTVVAAVALRQVYIALIVGIWLGCTFLYRFNPAVGLLRSFDTYFTQVLSYDTGHAAVLVFCILLGGLIGIVQRSGGAQGLGQLVTRCTTSRRRGVGATLGLSLAVFFDDYSCILIVGTTFRRIAPDFGMSQEKLALIVHTVACCFSSMMPISSWVGVEVGYIQGQPQLSHQDPFVWFMQSLPYRLFPVLMLAAVLVAVALDAELPPLAALEHAAARTDRQRRDRKNDDDFDGDSSGFVPLVGAADAAADGPEDEVLDDPLSPVEGAPTDRWYNAALPFGSVAVTTFVGMCVDGALSCHDAGVPATLLNIFTRASSFDALLWGSLVGCIVALALVLAQRIMVLGRAMEAWTDGIKVNLLEPMIILMFAWAIGQVIADLHAPEYLAQAVGGSLPAWVVPTLVQVLCFVMSFATGSAFGTMGIMFPLVVPLADSISHHDQHALLQCVGAILGGSIFGNVVSPIADDTILSAMACGCTIASHVATISPYVALAGAVSILCGTLPVGLGLFGIGPALLLSLVVIIAVTVAFGKTTDGHTVTSPWTRVRAPRAAPRAAAPLHAAPQLCRRRRRDETTDPAPERLLA